MLGVFGVMRRSITLSIAVMMLGTALAGCSMTDGELELQASGETRHPHLIPPNASHAEKGQIHYRDGSFGLAEKQFRAAVEKNPSNAEAWLGLAATYDQLRRFDHAGRAYKSVVKLVGYTPTVLNNLGYHYYLQGNRRSALQTLERARRADPDNSYIGNNLDMVRSAGKKS